MLHSAAKFVEQAAPSIILSCRENNNKKKTCESDARQLSKKSRNYLFLFLHNMYLITESETPR